MPDTAHFATLEDAGWFRPATIAEAVAMKHRLRGAIYGGGLTALQLDWPDAVGGSQPDGPVIDISGLDFGPAVSETPDGRLRLAANAPLEMLRRNPLIRAFDALAQCLDGIAATGVRGLATLGGNLCTPSGDARTLCAAFETRLVTASGTAGYDPAVLQDDLLIAAEITPAPGFFDKVGHRSAFSPARALLAGAWRDGKLVLAARSAGAPITVTPATRAEEDLRLTPGASAEDAAILEHLIRARLKDCFA